MYRIFDALPEEAYTIRDEVFVKEQGFVEEFDALDETALHLLYYVDEVPVATTRLYPDEAQAALWHIGRVAVRRSGRGKAIGRALMAASEAVCRAHGAEAIEIHAQARAAGFYRACGYEQEGGVFIEEDCPHVLMKKGLGPV